MESTGAAGVLANFLLESIAQGNAIVALALILVVTMTLSDLMNNAATAAVMCPIAIGAATQLGVNADAFLTFSLDEDGRIREARIVPASELTDFSFDFQDLRLSPVKPDAKP